MLNNKLVSIILLVSSLFILTACSPSEGGGNNSEEKGKLVLYSGRSESLVAPIIEQFQADTGIEVEVRYGNTAELAATLLEEGQNSPADVFWAQDPGGLGAVADEGLFTTLPENITSRVPENFVSPENLWVGISGRARTVVYNTELLTKDDLPDDLWGFTDPKWDGKIGWAPTNGSFQVMVTGMRQIWGEERTREWLTGILANNPVVYEKNTPTVAAVGAGEVEVGFVNHYYLYRFLAEEGESFPAANYFLPGGGPGSLVMVAGAGILETAPNKTNAEQFLDYLLSEKAQNFFRDETNEYPVIEGIELPDNLVPLNELNSTPIDLGDLADLQGTVQLLQEVGALP